MSAIGIIAEYNPLHEGHIYHIRRSKELGKLPVVCVMSGTAVQRGELACMSKWTRARAAVQHGADLVFELPAPYACSSADGFALGAVYLLNACGVVSILSFGSERGDIAPLTEACDALENADPKPFMSGGASYPAAISRAAGDVLSTPNNMLGVAYLKALRRLNSDIVPVTVKRIGAGHDQSGGEMPSAKDIRERLFAGLDAKHYCDGGLVSLESQPRLVLAALRGMNAEQWRGIEDVSEGLEHRLARAAQNAASLEELYSLCKCKRYTMARIRRVILRAYLGIPPVIAPPPYLRVLALNGTGAELLKRIKKTCPLPVITKPAAYKELDQACRALFELEIRITDTASLHGDAVIPTGRELRESPFVLPE